jgi:RNA-directed DNA polymerase
MKGNQLPSYLRRHWPKIRADLLSGTYRPLAVRRKEIPKPSGGVRLLGIPTALDRLIQSKFFDRVNHDRRMSRLATKVHDKRVLKLVRGFLTAGTMIGGLQEPSQEGTPQGGPLSPLLSNIVLDEFDKELEKRGLRFVRYADDCAPRRRGEEALM